MSKTNRIIEQLSNWLNRVAAKAEELLEEERVNEAQVFRISFKIKKHVRILKESNEPAQQRARLLSCFLELETIELEVSAMDALREALGEMKQWMTNQITDFMRVRPVDKEKKRDIEEVIDAMDSLDKNSNATIQSWMAEVKKLLDVLATARE